MSSCTYFIGGDVGPVKIGRTTDLDARLARLQTGSPVVLRVLGAVALDRGATDPRTLEAECHECLAASRLHGEWFDRGAARAFWDHAIAQDHADYIIVDTWEPRERIGVGE